MNVKERRQYIQQLIMNDDICNLYHKINTGKEW